ncbi:5'-3' exonuclease H3TH domain-containing protein [Oceanobacter sp. 3_MG-2023]|uniref:5'-3' exonuclease H3TH domain-containing protein n=1 Tax=Oceanobacter sp. 3_MG-2023 TaxID=3062622 RepID=UPI0027372102|nr:5'-3' exonuclease H3TH domain-containing protein [Oceanobacter sp. 3_MG-2023]MDP2507145.1 5'-3' exonuclease H3TH domain-containing protein [Oceanobacter sp. 3_MG-2023]
MQLLIIDAMNLIRRVYAAVENSSAALEATASRAITIINSNAARLECSHVAMVFEDHGETWRHQLWPDYKKGRPPMPEALHAGLEMLRHQLELAGVYCFRQDGWEADDVCAALASKAALAGVSSVILSTDKGFCQLVNSRIRVANHFDRQLLDEAAVYARYGLRPGQLVDFWALTGDTTNHLPGVPGIGPKTAAQLLDHCQRLDRILIALGQLSELAGVTPRIVDSLQTHWQQALLTRELARLSDDMPLGINLHDLRFQVQDAEAF